MLQVLSTKRLARRTWSEALVDMIVGRFGRVQARSCCCSSDGVNEITDVFRCLTTVDFVPK